MTNRFESAASIAWPWAGAIGPIQEYWIDAWQRSILLLDVLRQRGNNYVDLRKGGFDDREAMRRLVKGILVDEQA